MKLAVGARAEVAADITEAMIDAFAALSGDVNRVHMDAEAARGYGFPKRVAHGCLTLSLLSTLIGTKLPGEGALWRTVDVEWVRPVFPGDRVVVSGEVVQVSEVAESCVISAVATNGDGTVVMRAKCVVGLLAGVIPETGHRRQATGDRRQAISEGARAVLVTGGSRGIGRAICRALGGAGFRVLVGFREGAEAARGVAEEVGGVAVGMDVLGEEWPGGEIVGLVHAATPGLRLKKIGEGIEDDLEGYLRAYVKWPLGMVRRMEAAMAAGKWGRVILLGTSAAIGVPPARMTAYVTAKSAALGLARSLAVELGPSGVTVNVVSPGLTATDLTRDVSPRAQLGEAQRTPLRRLATPEDTAALVAFLMSDAGGFITGAHLPVTGGMAMP